MSFLEIGGLFGSITSGYVTDKLIQKVGSASFTFGTDHSIALGEKRVDLMGLFEEWEGFGLTILRVTRVSQPSNGRMTKSLMCHHGSICITSKL